MSSGSMTSTAAAADAALRTAAQTPVGDPLVTIPAMAAATERISFGAHRLAPPTSYP